ncbi:MAG: phosphohydrolase [Treponema sp.]|nr:phosphohydrolase [Treponema sp.]
MKNFNKISCDEIKVGVKFSAPVFFDDGENMFLAEEKSAKQYHVAALARWNIPYLLSYGHVITGNDESDSGELYELESLDEIEELSDVDEIEALEEIA